MSKSKAWIGYIRIQGEWVNRGLEHLRVLGRKMRFRGKFAFFCCVWYIIPFFRGDIYIFLLCPIYYPLLPSAAARTKIAIHHLIGIDFKMRLYYDRRPPIVMEGLLRTCWISWVWVDLFNSLLVFLILRAFSMRWLGKIMTERLFWLNTLGGTLGALGILGGEFYR